MYLSITRQQTFLLYFILMRKYCMFCAVYYCGVPISNRDENRSCGINSSKWLGVEVIAKDALWKNLTYLWKPIIARFGMWRSSMSLWQISYLHSSHTHIWRTERLNKHNSPLFKVLQNFIKPQPRWKFLDKRSKLLIIPDWPAHSTRRILSKG